MFVVMEIVKTWRAQKESQPPPSLRRPIQRLTSEARSQEAGFRRPTATWSQCAAAPTALTLLQRIRYDDDDDDDDMFYFINYIFFI